MLKRLNSIKLKLLVVLVPGAIIALTVTLLITLYQSEQHFMKKLEVKKSSLNNYADLMTVPLWNFNSSRMESILNTMMLDPDLISVTVYDEGENAVFKRYSTDDDYRKSASIHLDFPLIYSNAHIIQKAGSMKVILGDKSLRQEQQQFIYSTLTSLFLVLVTLLAGVWLTFSYLLDGPIKKLITAIKGSDSEQKFIKVKQQSSDEFGLISQAFNEMQDRLASHHDKLKRHKEHLQVLYHSTPALLFSFDAKGDIQDASDYFLKRLGFSREQIIGHNLSELTQCQEQRSSVQFALKKLWSELHLNEFPLEIENGQGQRLEVLIDATLSACSAFPEALAVMTDVTSLNQARRKLEHQATTDPLSGMANRHHFQNYLDALIHDRRGCGATFALIFIDLDHFKSVNDTFGHQIGDQLICLAAERIKSALRPEDKIARLGGDEFAVILEQLESPADAEQIAKRVLKQLQQGFSLAESNIFISASLGIALYPTDSDNPANLVQCADMAMYRAKEDGRDCVAFYSEEHTLLVQERLKIENLLRKAIKQQLLEIHYQPIICLQNQQVAGFEALLRLKDDQSGQLISPNQFIPVAEETGLIVPIGEWCINQACAQLALWHKQLGPQLYMSVNVSTRQFQARSFLDSIDNAIFNAGISADKLMIEITESLLLHDNQNNLLIFEKLQQLGCRIAIDDFGTGFSALSYLMKFPLNVLKIDRLFVQQLNADENSDGLVSAIIKMAHSMELEVVAEGIEQPQQLRQLRQLSEMISIQGYLFTPPLNQSNLEQQYPALAHKAETAHHL